VTEMHREYTEKKLGQFDSLDECSSCHKNIHNEESNWLNDPLLG